MYQKESIQLEVAVTAKDHFNFITYRIRVLLTVLFLSIFISTFLLSWGGELFDHSIMLSLITALFATLIAFFVCWFLAYQLVKKGFNKNHLREQTVSYKIGREGIFIISIRGKSSIFWSDLYMVREQKDFFALFVSPSRAFLLPKRAFQSTEDIELFKKFILDLTETRKIYFN